MTTKPDHVERARRAKPMLERLAARRRTTSYKKICGRLGLHHRSARWFLGVIQTWCKENDLPPLQALVVNQKTRKPGKGYTATARSDSAHSSAVEEVWDFDWSSAPRL